MQQKKSMNTRNHDRATKDIKKEKIENIKLKKNYCYRIDNTNHF